MTRIIYIHVPKCGGSSFGAALRLRFLFSQATIDLRQGDPALSGLARIHDDYDRRGDQLASLVARQVRMIAGHVRYDRALHDAEARHYAFVTMLRDPVDRFVSHYNYLQRHHPDPTRARTLTGFLNSPDAARLATQYLFYFAPKPSTDPIGQALSNLHRFSLIGTLDQPGGFAQDLGGLIKGPLPHLRRNVAPRPTEVPALLRPQIEELCAPDMAIYDAVRKSRLAT